MENNIQPKNKYYAILSILSPILAFLFIVLFQQIMYSEFWLSVNESPRNSSAAVAMMAVGEFIQISFAILVGCVVGIVLAYFSFRKNNVMRKLSYIALIFNSIPLLIVTIFMLKGILYGV